MIKPKTFEEFLQDRHSAVFTQLLDDDIPDHFNNWMGEQDVDEIIEYADLYGRYRSLEGQQELLKEFCNY